MTGQSCQRCGEETLYLTQVFLTEKGVVNQWCLACVYRVGKSQRECQIEEAKEWAKCYD